MADEDTEKSALADRFARAVKSARELKGMSQAALANKIGASLDHVSKLERAKYLPGLMVAAELIKVLELDANALLDAQPSQRKVSRRRLDVEAELARLAEALDDRTLGTAVALVAVLAARAKS